MLAALLALTTAEAGGYEDGAPPGHTGGFGEPDCSACHSDYPTNATGGELAIEGLPEHYAPGESYRLAVVLLHPELASGGFQLAVRTAEGEPAGELLPASDRLQVAGDAGQRYLQHTRAGTRTETDGRIRWEFEWRAPEDPAPLVLNIAANAANDDLSALGDFIYTLEKTLAAGPQERALRAPAGAMPYGDFRNPRPDRAGNGRSGRPWARAPLPGPAARSSMP